MLAAVALALFGLLSMHGWGSHAAGHTMAMAPATSATTMDADHAADHSELVLTDEPAFEPNGDKPLGAASASGREDPGSDQGPGLLGLCLAVLCSLLLGIAVLVARRGIRIPRWLLPIWPHPVFMRRDRDPPDLLQLCVIRS